MIYYKSNLFWRHLLNHQLSSRPSRFHALRIPIRCFYVRGNNFRTACGSFWKAFLRTRFESLLYRDSSEKICRTPRSHSNSNFNFIDLVMRMMERWRPLECQLIARFPVIQQWLISIWFMLIVTWLHWDCSVAVMNGSLQCFKMPIPNAMDFCHCGDLR